MQFGGENASYALLEVGSTNEYAKALAKAGAVSGTVVWAHRQTQGKGTRNRTWESLDGNVFWSGIIQLKDIGRPFTELVYVNALAVYNTITQYIDAPAQAAIKWPNDILLHEKKVAGSLLECGKFDAQGKPAWMVLGTGINVAASPRTHPSMLYPPISLKESGYDVSREAVIETLNTQLGTAIAAWLQQGFSTVREAYLAKAFRLYEEIAIGITPDKADYVTGQYLGIDEQGAIMVACSDNTIKKFHSGDVLVRS
ncbi:MAG: biotin--[acetyl-CoA-carboxylase] ligase [Treponema sp.]|jgi:BirA family biotin operon repressor/biotin-[acetyl-CoA-carboxylase] ligase|nr:biotin--[acetyl-CoA-carboxylase] ligase [Treponema sp.]